MADKAKIIVISGPTASGKTSLSVELAKKLNGEIICADSMQIYKYLNIGTAKVTNEEMQGIKHHLVGFLPPEQRFSVADYVKLADECIKDITARHKTPIIVGGTGLYIESLVKGVQFTQQKTDLDLRDKLKNRLNEQGIMPLYEELKQVDEEAAKNIHPNNHGRVLRALELYLQTGKTMSQQKASSLPKEKPYNDALFCLSYSNRQTLYDRINLRVDIMMAQGLLEEAKFVYENKEQYITAAQAIGYKEFFSYFENEASLEACVDLLKQASRNYAKRQLTWFKRMENVNWLEAGETALDSAMQIVSTS